jgi:AraC-like DNA-binding protein
MKLLYENKHTDFYHRTDNNRSTVLTYRPHVHYHIELVYLKKGGARAFIDSVEYTVDEGDLVVVFPNQVHRYEDIGPCPEYDLFIINPELIADIMQSFENQEPEDPVIKKIAKNPRLLTLINILSSESDFPKASREILLRGYLLALFGELLEKITLKSVRSDEGRALRSIIKFCSKNFKQEISLSVLSDRLHLSKYYISHLFSDKLGISFTDYVNSLRVSESCVMLRSGAMSITEIAYAVGFGTLRTFNRAFVKQMGISPSEYRRGENKKDDVEHPLHLQKQP